MAQPFSRLGRVRCWPWSARGRLHDSGGPSRDPAWSSEPEGSGEGLRGAPADGGQFAAVNGRTRSAHQGPFLHADGRAGGAAAFPPAPWRSTRWVEPRLPQVKGNRPAEQVFETHVLGCFRTDITGKQASASDTALRASTIPGIKGRVERMNGTLSRLRQPPPASAQASPYKLIGKAWATNPRHLTANPTTAGRDQTPQPVNHPANERSGEGTHSPCGCRCSHHAPRQCR